MTRTCTGAGASLDDYGGEERSCVTHSHSTARENSWVSTTHHETNMAARGAAVPNAERVSARRAKSPYDEMRDTRPVTARPTRSVNDLIRERRRSNKEVMRSLEQLILGANLLFGVMRAFLYYESFTWDTVWLWLCFSVLYAAPYTFIALGARPRYDGRRLIDGGDDVSRGFYAQASDLIYLTSLGQVASIFSRYAAIFPALSPGLVMAASWFQGIHAPRKGTLRSFMTNQRKRRTVTFAPELQPLKHSVADGPRWRSRRTTRKS